MRRKGLRRAIGRFDENRLRLGVFALSDEVASLGDQHVGVVGLNAEGTLEPGLRTLPIALFQPHLRESKHGPGVPRIRFQDVVERRLGRGQLTLLQRLKALGQRLALLVLATGRSACVDGTVGYGEGGYGVEQNGCRQCERGGCGLNRA